MHNSSLETPGHNFQGQLLLLTILIGAVFGLTTCDHPSTPQVAFDHARQTFIRGNLVQSQEEADRGYQRFQISSPEWAWKFRILEAESMMWRGMSKQVLVLLDSTMLPLTESDAIVPSLTLQGVAHAHLHEFSEAERKLDAAEQLCKGSSNPDCGGVIRARGVLAWEHGKFTPAQQYFEKALTFARNNGDRFLEATALLNLGAAFLQEEHFDEAIDSSDSARQLATLLQANEIEQSALGNLGWAYYSIGNSETALGLFVDAEKRAMVLGDVIDQVRWSTTVGYIYLDKQNFSAAERSYQQGLDLAKQINSKGDVFNALTSLALTSEQTGKLEEANQYADQAFAMAREDSNRHDELYPLLVKARVYAEQHDSTNSEHLFRKVEQDPANTVSLKWEAEHELARLYESENHADSAEQEYRASLTTFETARSSLQHEESELPFLTNASRIYDDYIHFLVAEGKTDRALQVADYSRARTLAEGLGFLQKGTTFSPAALNAQDVARRAGGTILFYSLGEKQSYLWAITSRKTSLFSLPPASEIDAIVQRYRKALLGPQDVLETANADGAALYRMLVEPAKSMLKNGKILIIPDGSLNGLNFETLLIAQPKLHYWIEDATISNANSLRLLSLSKTPSNKENGKLLLIGDPISPNSEYGELPKAALEMENIEKHFASTDRTTYARSQATTAAYLTSKPEQFSYIHFVAHGTASRLSPLDSAVVLSQSPGYSLAQTDSYKLYARDIIRHPLHADLVTISTCLSAGTRSYTGEGLVGLSWAFLRAGAHNVVGALWEVNDTSTPPLMDQFYAELKKGRSPDAALRAAKLSLLNSAGSFRKPFYWAPFQLYSGS
ncbi:MAG TPA: CHAT domain-containing protein [Terriglobales bacterium]|nr:CHAT domain-containing protein [Terriglobales bacterium]